MAVVVVAAAKPRTAIFSLGGELLAARIFSGTIRYLPPPLLVCDHGFRMKRIFFIPRRRIFPMLRQRKIHRLPLAWIRRCSFLHRGQGALRNSPAANGCRLCGPTPRRYWGPTPRRGRRQVFNFIPFYNTQHLVCLFWQQGL